MDLRFEAHFVKDLFAEEKKLMQEYGTKEKIWDAIACVMFAISFFVLTWVAFAMDVITTGM